MEECRWCKGTGKVVLLTSSAVCLECQKTEKPVNTSEWELVTPGGYGNYKPGSIVEYKCPKGCSAYGGILKTSNMRLLSWGGCKCGAGIALRVVK